MSQPQANGAKQNIKLLVLLLLFTTFSGAVRKWGISSQLVGNLILITQLIFPFVFALAYRKAHPYTNRFDPVLVLFTLMLVVLALNPLNQTIYHGVLGVIVHLGFWLLIFSYLNHRSVFPVLELNPLILTLIGIQFAISAIQYASPETSFINKYVADTDISKIAKVGTSVRTSGTFSYISGLSSFVTMVAFVFWGQSIYTRNRLTPWLLLAAGVLMSLYTGSRGTVLVFVLFLVFSRFPYPNARYLASGTLRLIPLVVLLALSAVYVRPLREAIANLQTRIASNIDAGETEARILSSFTEVLDFRGDYPLFGIGLGATYQGANAIWGESVYAQRYEGGYEEEGERIILEGGYVLYLFRIVLYLLMFRAMSIPTAYKFALFVLMVFYTNMVFNVYNGVFIFVGLMYLDQSYLHRQQPPPDEQPT